MWETWVRSLGGEDPLEKEMATYSNILAWRIPWTEKPSRLQSMGSQRVRHDWATSPYHLNTNKRVLFLPPSDAYVRSFLYLLYTLIKLYYTKALRDQASSLAPDWILLLQGPRILALWFNNNLSLPGHHCFPWLKSWPSFLFMEFRTCQWLLVGHTVTKVQLWCFSV